MDRRAWQDRQRGPFDAPLARPGQVDGLERRLRLAEVQIGDKAEADHGHDGLILGAFAIADLPDPVASQWRVAVVTDGASGKHIAVSNGVAWLYADGTAV